MSRRQTRSVKAGSVGIGSAFPVTIQTMTNIPLGDVKGTLAQIERCGALGCDLIRAAVDDERAEKALPEVIRNSPLPLIADIQFHWESALAAIRSGIAGVRLNPGLIRDENKLRPIAELAKEYNTCIRVGANGGSVNPVELEETLKKFPTFEEAMADLLCRSALRQCEALESYGVRNIKVALKSSSIPVTLASYRKFASETDYPLHLGLTESGPPSRGIIKSAAVLSVLLMEGIGDTVRISLTADPEEEIIAAKGVLEACGVRKAAPELVSCPSCGRTEFDLFGLTEKVDQLLREIEKDGLEVDLKKVAVMGCPVNGPGEARDADLGIAGSRNGKVILFCSGVVRGTYDADEGFEIFKNELLKHTRKRRRQN